MRVDVQVETYVDLGVWDEGVGRQKMSKGEYSRKRYDRVLEADAEQGKLFLIRTDGIAGGRVRVYVGQEAPAEERGRMRDLGGREFLLLLPSGRMVVGGIEDYRSRERLLVTDAHSVIDVGPGDYVVRCSAWTGDEWTEEEYEAAMVADVGREDWKYYQRVRGRGGCLGCQVPILLWLLSWVAAGWWVRGLGWSDAAAVFGVGAMTWVVWVLVGAAYLAWDTRVRSRDERYGRVRRAVREYIGAREGPLYVLEMRRVEGRGELRGGSVTACGRRGIERERDST